MHSAIRRQNYGIMELQTPSVFHLPSSIFRSCGVPGYNLSVRGGIGAWFINTPRTNHSSYVYNRPQNTHGFAQLGTSLCTTFQHILRTISSGGRWIVHIIHRAYKKEYELKKGIK